MSGTTLQFSTEYPYVYASDAAMIAVPSSNFPPGTMVLSLESGLYMFDNSTLGIGVNDLLDSDNMGLFRKSNIPFIYVDDNSVISDLNVGPASIPDNSITNIKINSAAGISFSKLQTLPSNFLIAGVSNVATACNVAGDVVANASGTTVNLTVPSLANYLPLAGGTMTGTLLLGGTQTADNAAATVAYVNSVAVGLNKNASCLAATVGANIVATYNNGAAGVGGTLTVTATGAFSLDGQAGVLNGRYLIKDQSTTSQNGIYTLTTVGSLGVSPVLTRAVDFNTPSSITDSGLIPVQFGTVNADTIWLETNVVVVVGTDPIVFSLFAKPSLYLQIANNLSDVASASASRTNLGVAIGTNVQAWSAVLDTVTAGTYAGDASIVTVGTISSGVWHGGIIGPTYGGTGVNNGSSTITIPGNFSLSGGAFSFAGTLTGNTTVTFPTSGTLLTSASLAGYLQAANNLSDVASASTSRSNLGLAIGTDVQAWSATLDAVAGGTYAGAASITIIGTIATGVWHGTVIGATYGGTGVNNGSSTITIGGNVAFSGSFSFTGTLTGNTSVTFPTSGTLLTSASLAGYLQAANNLSDVASAATSRTNLGLAIGTNVQAWSAVLDTVTAGTYSGSTSITTVGTINTGTWYGAPILAQYGGTGVDNGANVFTMGAGSVTFTGVGPFGFTATLIGNTNVTFPDSGTLLTSASLAGYLQAANNLSDVANAATSRSNLGLAIGTNVQAYSATLAAVAGGTYTGASSITTVGTITSGTWSGAFGAVSGANLTNLNAANIGAGTVDNTTFGYLSGATSNIQAQIDAISSSDAFVIATYTSADAVTGDGTIFYIDSWTENLDTGNAFNPSTGVFTLPSTNVCQINLVLRFENMTSSNTSASVIVNSNDLGTFVIADFNPWGLATSATSGEVTFNANLVFQFSSADTLTFGVQVGGTGADSVVLASARLGIVY